MKDMPPPGGTDEGPTFEIRFRGRLGCGWSAWVSGLLQITEAQNGDFTTTCLTVRLPDQAALRGILNRLWDLNLALISVRVVEPAPAKENDHG